MPLITEIVEPTGTKHTATVIFFHGSGDSGNYLLEWVRYLLGQDMQFAHVKMIFPSAPSQAYTPLGGEVRKIYLK